MNNCKRSRESLHSSACFPHCCRRHQDIDCGTSPQSSVAAWLSDDSKLQATVSFRLARLEFVQIVQLLTSRRPTNQQRGNLADQNGAVTATSPLRIVTDLGRTVLATNIRELAPSRCSSPRLWVSCLPMRLAKNIIICHEHNANCLISHLRKLRSPSGEHYLEPWAEALRVYPSSENRSYHLGWLCVAGRSGVVGEDLTHSVPEERKVHLALVTNISHD